MLCRSFLFANTFVSGAVIKTCSRCGCEIGDNQVLCDDCFEDSMEESK